MKHALISSMIFTAMAIVPITIYAQTPQQGATTIPQQGASVQQQGASTRPATASGRLENPLRGANSIGELFRTLAQFAIDLAYIVIAAFLLLSGFKFVKAQGNPEELAKAKATFWYTIIGALIIIGMDTMIAVFKRILEQLR
jgi:hypothetical protein